MKTFVFIPSQTGPQPQLWHDMPKDGNGKDKIAPLFKYELTELEEYDFDTGQLTLKILEERFRDKLVPNSEQSV